MNRATLAPYSVLFIAATALVSGCVTTSLRAVTGGVSAQGGRIVVERVDGDIIKMIVLNESPMPMVIYRDRVTLWTSQGERGRTPNTWGGAGVYTVEPSKSHKLNVRFDLSGLSAEQKVELRLNDAVEIQGRPVQFRPIPFVVTP